MSWREITIEVDRIGTREGTTRGTRVYVVEGNSNLDPDEVRANTSTTVNGITLPAMGDAYNTGSPAIVIGKEAELESPQCVKLTVSYSSKATDQATAIENPLARPTLYRYGGQPFTEPYFRDVDGEPNVNSAGEEFADLPQRQNATGVIEITDNVASFDNAANDSRRNTINGSTVAIGGQSYAEATVYVDQIEANGPFVENGVTYYTRSVRLLTREAGWDDVFEDRGLNELDGGELVPIKDQEGNQVQLPYPLNGSGSAAASPTATPAQIVRKPYVRASFAWL
ncbi:MAG: hypothetical protein AAGE65_13695 [Planctomycetota bacterium]